MDMQLGGLQAVVSTGKPKTDLGRAFAQLHTKRKPYDTQFAYYDGDQPIVYATDQLNAYFQQLTARFVENWCAPVIDAVLERLTLKGFDTGKANPAAKAALDTLMQAGGLEMEAYDAHHAALVAGEASIIVWPSDVDGEAPDVYHNDPRLVAVFYDPARPKLVAYAAKWWLNESNGHTYLTLYYADRVEHYWTRTEDEPRGELDFVPVPPEEGAAVEPHDYGRVPVFHFRRNRRRITGELQGKVISLQDMVNKLLADMMVSSEFAAFRQRWAVSAADLSKLQASAGALWRIPPGEEGQEATQVGEFNATDLQNFILARTALAESIAIISHTPKHYMTGASQPSGEALLAMEAPLVKKVQHYTELFGATWRDLACFYCKLQGIDLRPQDVTPVWEQLEAAQPAMSADSRLKNTQAGMPLKTVLRDEGWGPDELAQLEIDQKDQAKAQPPTLGEVALKAAAANFSAGRTAPQPPSNGDQPATAPAPQPKA
jgi:hypothetical protein